MAYEIRVGRTPGKGFKRVARQQLRRIVEMLEDIADAANGHHEARKCVKRLRALTILTRPAVGEARWAKIDRSFAKLAKALSGARDTTVILQLLDRLERDQAGVLGDSGRKLRAKLRQRPRSGVSEVDLEALSRRTKRLGKSIDDLPSRGLKIGTLIRSLAADYHAGRQAYEHAYAEGTLRYRMQDLLWRPSGRIVRFVAVVHPTRGNCLLMCTDTTLDPVEIIRIYGLRFNGCSFFGATLIRR